ncbi:MAG: 3-isopropylmalate dehydratase small subunit [Anaerolineales bacterium]|nr:3-isopropylmalate dehydratase small subunit [Anaerolineales bacterium]
MKRVQFNRLTSHVAPLLMDDVDTDQIIPARYLKVTDKQGLGEGLFAEWRYDRQGNTDPEFALNLSQAQGAEILLVGRNFGCGSSREHAVWALLAKGIRVVIAQSFADIFRGNALKNGLLVVQIGQSVHAKLAEMVVAAPSTEVTVDLASQELLIPDLGGVQFAIDEFSKRCLIEGLDSLGYLLSAETHIRKYEASHE